MVLSGSLAPYCDNISLPMDNRSCLRRIARHEDTVFSNQSIMNVMEKFVKAVNDMEETILVPCRLMDLKVGDAGDTVEVETTKLQKKAKQTVRDMADTDLYNLYMMVNTVKRELLWGQGEEVPKPAMVPVSSSSLTGSTKGHVRRPSTASMSSTNSTNSMSDTDSENGNENDSGIEGEDTPDYSQEVATNFRRHLHGLHSCLQQMTDAAGYLTTRYQNDVGGAV